MMANPLLFWAWSAPGSFWAWRALVASFWPGVPWLIFGLECLGSFWRPGEPLVEFFRPGVPLVCFGLECLVPFLAWSAPGYAVTNGELGLMGRVFERLTPVSGSCHMIVTWSALHTAFVFLWVVFLTTKWHGRSGKSTSVSARVWNWECSASLRKAADLASSPLCPHECG